MSRSTIYRLLVLLFAFALVAAACGSSDSDSSAGGDDVASPESSEDESSGSDSGLATEGVVELAAGTSVDLSVCPDDWSATTGVDGDEIRFGQSLPQTGALAAFGPIADGIEAYFDWVNANDPIDGKELVLVARDDAYESGRTVANIEEMIDTEEIFAFTTIIGSPNNGAARPILDEACVPQAFNATGLPDWGDPASFPWTVGGLLAYNTEASLWCENIVSELGEGATVAALFMNNDFGAAYQSGIEGCAADGLIDLVANEVHEATAPDITNEMTNMIASEADAFIFGSTSAFCPQSVGGIASSTWRPLFYMSNTCSNLAAFFEPVQDAAGVIADEGSAVRMVSNVKNFTDPTYSDDPAIVEGIQILADAGLDEAGSQSTGIIFGYYTEQTLRKALADYGEINRVTFMAAAWNLNIEASPYLLDGIGNITDGTNDAFLVEGARVEEVIVDGGALTFSPVSELISVEGTTGTFGG